MGYYRFVKEDSIHHSKEVVMSYINKLKPLKYNRFLWWKTHTDGIEPLGKRAPLKDRILNGDFNPSTYYWQAQLSLYTAFVFEHLTIYPIRVGIILKGKLDGLISCVYSLFVDSGIINTELG